MKKTNVYLVFAGIVEILFAAAYAFVGVMFFVVGIFALALESGAEGGSSDSTLFFALLCLMILGILVSLALCIVFFVNCRKTHEQLVKRKGLMITAIVFAFVFGVVICGSLALAGYLQNDTPTNQNNESANSAQSSVSEVSE